MQLQTEYLDLRLMDNMQLMAQYPDKHFELAICDPPYGIGAANGTNKWVRDKFKDVKNWDNSHPPIQYFNELFRVSQKQVIWGANHFSNLLPPTPNFCIWDKKARDRAFGDSELAFVYNVEGFGITNGRVCEINTANINYNGVRIHPTQKPTTLYKWLLDKYAKAGDKILDTHLGSGSIAIACHDYKYHLTACELDSDYFAAMQTRVQNHLLQTNLF
jgi:site-specific DNA-methyltransferase (adenine-specific)